MEQFLSSSGNDIQLLQPVRLMVYANDIEQTTANCLQMMKQTEHKIVFYQTQIEEIKKQLHNLKSAVKSD